MSLPPTRPTTRRPSGARIAIGIFRLARFDAGGLGHFADSREGFLGSLAPLVAFPLVGGLLMLIGGEGLPAIADMLATLSALLAPAVLSHFLAAAWRREAAWLRYATAFNWCQWAILLAAVGLLLLLGVLISAGLPNDVAGTIAAAGIVGYGLALHWFLARRGLGLGWLPAALLVIVVNVGTTFLVLLPRLLLIAAGEA